MRAVVAQHQGKDDALFALSQIQQAAGANVAGAVMDVGVVKADGGIERQSACVFQTLKKGEVLRVVKRNGLSVFINDDDEQENIKKV